MYIIKGTSVLDATILFNIYQITTSITPSYRPDVLREDDQNQCLRRITVMTFLCYTYLLDLCDIFKNMLHD